MSDYQNEYEGLQRREKEFEKQNGEGLGQFPRSWGVLR